MGFKGFLFWLVAPVFLMSCERATEKQQQYAAIKRYFENRQKTSFEGVDAVYILGVGCPGCVRAFATRMDEIDRPESVVLNIVMGGDELELEHARLFRDYQLAPEYDILRESGVIYLKENEVDTIIRFDARELPAQFEFIFGF